MASSTDNQPESEKDWFDRLPKKTQIVLLMLLMLAVAAICFLMGVHALHPGVHADFGSHHDDPVEDFFWCAFCLAITGLLFGAYMGWFKGNKDDPPK
jgi:membrane associated rhomboid family serine protease